MKKLTICLFLLLTIGWNALASVAQGVPPPVSPSAPTMLDLSAWRGKTIVLISAHPDDIEACAAGMVYLLTSQYNVTVKYIIVTNGDKGCSASFCLNSTSQEISVIRYGEALNAAAIVGVDPSNVNIMDYEDAMVTAYNEVEIRMRLTKAIRESGADVAMTWFPYPQFKLRPSQGWGDLGYHPDHQAVGKLTLDAYMNSGIKRLFPDLGSPARPGQFYFFSFTDDRTHCVDIGQAGLKQKIAAYLAHKSQYFSSFAMSYMLTTLASEMAKGTPATYAECFQAYF